MEKFCSYIGTPFFIDRLTGSQGRVSFVGVCVEVKVDTPMPTQIPYVNEFRKSKIQEVEYEWIPPNCSHCKKFGHTLRQCSVVPRETRKWVPKQVGGKA